MKYLDLPFVRKICAFSLQKKPTKRQMFLSYKVGPL